MTNEEVKEERVSTAMKEIEIGFRTHGCKGCPFLGIEEYGIQKRCDGSGEFCLWHMIYLYGGGEE